MRIDIRHICIAAAGISLSIIDEALAETLLQCDYGYSHNTADPSLSGPTTGGFVVAIIDNADGTQGLNFPNLPLCGHVEEHSITENEIFIFCSNRDDEDETLAGVTQSIRISRVTGAFEHYFFHTNRDGAPIRTSECQKTKQKF